MLFAMADRAGALAEDEPDAERGAPCEDEDAYIEEMYGAPDPEEPADEIALREERETFRFHGASYILHEMPQDSLVTSRRLGVLPLQSLWGSYLR